MDDAEVGRYWESNAEAWTVLSRAGYDRLRDTLNTPRFLDILPDVKGLAGLDIGCGEGTNTRHVARLGATMTAIDIAPTFLRHARQSEQDEPLGIRYIEASAQSLPFEEDSFDFAVAFMSLMDVPSPERAIEEAFRVVRPGGFFQFSILHPCFHTHRWEWARDERGERNGIICGEYFERYDGEVEQWTFSAAPDEDKARYPEFQVPRFFRTLSEWLNKVIETGFMLTRIQEPAPDAEAVARDPSRRVDRIFPWVLHVQCCKPA